MRSNKTIMVNTPYGDRDVFFKMFMKQNQEDWKPLPYQQQLYDYLTSDKPVVLMMGRSCGKSTVKQAYIEAMKELERQKKQISFKEFYNRNIFKGKYKRWK